MPCVVGIAFVVDDIRKGCNLAFRYPSPPSSSVTFPSDSYTSSSLTNPTKSTDNNETPPSSSSSSDHTTFTPYTTNHFSEKEAATSDGANGFHRIGSSVFAKLFRPKNALCNQIFQLTIDDLHFISYPITISNRSCSDSTPPILTTASAGNITSAGSTTPSTTTSKNETSMFNIVLALNARKLCSNHSLVGGSHCVCAKMNRKCSNKFYAPEAFQSIVTQLSNALLHEELRAGFVSKEAKILLHIRDELAQLHHRLNNDHSRNSTSETSGDAGGGTGNITNNIEVEAQTLIDVALEKSMLANNLKDIFHGLEENGIAHIALNQLIQLSLKAEALNSVKGLQISEMRPYHTILLLNDEDKLLNSLPADCSPQLRLLIHAANPLSSFQELALETGIALPHLFRLSSHLVYWGACRVIDTLTKHNIYQVSESADLRKDTALGSEFARKFHPHTVSEILSTFSVNRRIGEYMKNLSHQYQPKYIHMLIWLLQHSFIFQFHHYVYLMLPDKENSLTNYNFNADAPGNSFPSHLLEKKKRQHHHHKLNNASNSKVLSMNFSSPYRLESKFSSLSSSDRNLIERLCPKNPNITALFKRLCQYFNGKYHEEEIMWRENVTRSELRTVLNTFKDITVTCVHE